MVFILIIKLKKLWVKNSAEHIVRLKIVLLLFSEKLFTRRWNFFIKHLCFQGRGSGLTQVLLLAFFHVLFFGVCFFFFYSPHLPLSELTLLKVNVAFVSADSALWKENLFIPVLKISFKRSEEFNAFLINLCIAPSLRNLLILIHGKKSLEPVSYVASYWKDHLGFQSGELQSYKWWKVKSAHGLRYNGRRFWAFSHQSGILSVPLPMHYLSKFAAYLKMRNLSALEPLTSLFGRSDWLWRKFLKTTYRLTEVENLNACLSLCKWILKVMVFFPSTVEQWQPSGSHWVCL